MTEYFMLSRHFGIVFKEVKDLVYYFWPRQNGWLAIQKSLVNEERFIISKSQAYRLVNQQRLKQILREL